MIAVQLFDVELTRMTFIVGIAVGVVLYERTHTTTGSLVVPGYVGAHLLDPVALVATALNAWITFLLVSRLLPRFAAIYGRSLFVANIAVSVMLALLLGPVVSNVAGPSVPYLDAIGYVVPALIAYDMNRQGPSKTGVAVMVAGAMAATPALVIVALAPHRVDRLLPLETGLLPIGEVWFPIIALVSTGVSASLVGNYGLRAGGFIGPMYLGLAAVRPAQIVFFLGVAVVIYGVVHRVLRPTMIMFGRRKFAVMLMAGSVVSWALVEQFAARQPGLLQIANLPIAALFVPALLANDMERTSVRGVLLGSYLGATSTLSIVLIVANVVDQNPVPMWAYPMMVVSTAALLWPRLARHLEGRPPANGPAPETQLAVEGA